MTSDRSQGGPSRRSLLRATVAASGAAMLAGCTFEANSDGIDVDFGSGDGESDADDGGTEGESDADDGGTEGESDADDGGTEGESESGEDDSDGDVEPSFDQDCSSHDPTAIELEERDGDWYVIHDQNSLLHFEEFDNAQRARDLIRAYELDGRCYVGRPNAPMMYWLVDGAAPSEGDAAVTDEDCIGFDRSALELEEHNDSWVVVSEILDDDSEVSLITFESEENAELALDVIEHYRFERLCFVGRPNAPMMYWTR